MALTKKIALSVAIASLKGEAIQTDYTNEEIISKLEDMISLLNKNQALTERQKENERFKDSILLLLSDRKARTATEILNNINFPVGMTSQRVSAILRQLYLEQKIDKDNIKGRTVFIFR